MYKHNAHCSFCLTFGPLVRYWTMRYEARHHFFKRLAQNIGNFINLSYTLALRHQLLQCYYHQSDTFLDSEVEIGPGKVPEINVEVVM